MKDPRTPSVAGVLRLPPSDAVRRITRPLTRRAVRARALPLAALLLASGAPDARISRGTVPPSSGKAGLPDLVPVTDSGRQLEFTSRFETRYAFWARNAGDAPSPGSRIRLKVSYRPYHEGYTATTRPWTQHANITFDIVPILRPGQESRALVSRILEWSFSGNPLAIDARNWKQPHGDQVEFRWEFIVDDGDGNHESNEANNLMVLVDTLGLWRGWKFETGPSGKFH